jgi:ACS family hexuronate transporter-like MFS transporter
MIPARWIAIGVFAFSSALNYLDRQLLAAAAPQIKAEFQLSNREYGLIVSVFSIIYAAASPLAGLFIDKVGLNRGACLAVGAWSLTSILTGFTTSFRGLLACRAALGVAEAGGVPAYGKANGLYLKPSEFALGTAMNQAGISLGSLSAPLIMAALAPLYGWKAPFIICGLLGFVWIPVWLATSRRIPPETPASSHRQVAVKDVVQDRRFWGLIVGNSLVMTIYTLWSNWTTLYFVQARGMSAEQANQQYAWIPPVFATLGAFFGGWLTLRLTRAGMEVTPARMRVCFFAAAAVLVTAAIPYMPSAFWAAAAISLSYFACLVMSTNIYALPIDYFGAGRAAFGVSALTFSFGLMQTLASPFIGQLVDQFGFGVVCFLFSLLPALGMLVLWLTRPRQAAAA